MLYGGAVAAAATDAPAGISGRDTRALLRGLDAAQAEAVTTTAAPLAVIAAAGSGKTTVLTRRIAYRLLTDTADARHVLALTFTRDAAGELKRRLRRLDLRTPIEAGTFHAVALRLLRDRAEAARQAPPHVAPDRLRLVREVLTELRLRLDPHGVAADLDWARARLVEPGAYERACRSARRRSTIPMQHAGQLFEAYGRLKRQRGVLDFDDLLERVTVAMRDDPAWAAAVRWRFRHLFVDEAQDLNPLQHAMLEAIRDGRPDLCLVGDPRQAVYGWNGADHRLLADVGTHYPGVTIVRLDRNYRCSPQVVRAGAAALQSSGLADASTSDRPGGPAVAVTAYDTGAAEAEGVAEHVRHMLYERPGRDIAVLARTNEQLVAFEAQLSARGIVTERSAGRSPLEIALRAATGCGTREQLAAWIDTAHANAADPGASAPDAATREAVMLVATEADRFLASGEPGTFRAFIEAAAPFDELLADRRAEAVSLLTFHAAKGREWWGVVVTGVEEGLVPHASATTESQLSEEARLFYVALTRAEHRLVVTHARRRGRGAVAPSRWLDAVRASADADAPAPPPPEMRRTARQRPADPLETYLSDLRSWRAAVARAAGVAERAVCSDDTLRSLAASPPADAADLARRLGITPTAAERLRPLPAPPTDTEHG